MSYINKPLEVKHSQAALRVEGYAVPRVQSLGYTADLNAEEVFELGRAGAVEIVNSDPTVSLTIDMHDYGTINFLNQISTSYKFQLGNTNNNAGTTGDIPYTEFETSVKDFNVVIREGDVFGATAGEGSDIRVAWFGECTLDSISGNYQVDGFATESFSFSGANQTWFLTKPYIAVSAVYVGTTTLHAYSGSNQPSEDFTRLFMTGIDKNDTKLFENGIIISVDNYTYSNGIVTATTGTYTSGARYTLLVAPHDNRHGHAFPDSTLAGNEIAGLKEREIEIALWSGNVGVTGYGDDAADTDTILRLQSVDYELSLDREDLKQLFTGLYSRSVNETNITASISALDSDLQLWAYGIGERGNWMDGTPKDEFSLTDFQNMGDLTLRISLFQSPSTRTAATLLKTITLTGGKVTNIGDSFDVPGRGTVSMELSFTGLTYHGTAVEGRSA